MKVELDMISKKMVVMAGFCACFNGLIVGISEVFSKDIEITIKVLNSYSLSWGKKYHRF
jgi:hypothetical protein